MKYYLLIIFLSVFCQEIDGIDEKAIQVSELPVSHFVPPNCNYTVRKGDKNGDVVKG